MTNAETVANPAIVTAVLLACVVGIVFMVLFFIALAREEKSARPSYAIRLRGVNCEAEIARAAAPSRMPVVSPTAYVAMGVVRITTALGSSAGRILTSRLTGSRWSGSTGRTQNSIFQTSVIIARPESEQDRRARICET